MLITSLLTSFGYVLYDKIKNAISSRKKNEILDQMKDTPLIYIKSLSDFTKRNIYAKCEYALPFACKDRIIKNILLTAEKEGKINKDSVIYEGSSGSTGFSVASICKLMGYKCVIVIPDNITQPRLEILKSTGCTVKPTKSCPYSNFKENFLRLSKKLAAADPNGFYINQYFNTTNMETHYNETGPEIYNQLGGNIDSFVCSAGTGGTISGISRYLKHKNANIQVFLADIQASGMSSYVKEKVMFTTEEGEGKRKKEKGAAVIEGIGLSFLTDNFKDSMIDDAYKITDDEALFMQKYIYENERIYIGGSSAVNLCGVLKACRENKVPEGGNIVTILFEHGTKCYPVDVKIRDSTLNNISQI